MSSNLKLGFTGTRKGMTVPQRAEFVAWLKGQREPFAEFHHGACVGADEEAALIVRELMPECVVHAHPGRSAHGGDNEFVSRQAIDASNITHPTDTHFARNRAIVAACDLLAAAPPSDEPLATGGTWYTIERATKAKKSTWIFWPRGVSTWRCFATVERMPMR